jgi:hypothetical protein
MTSNLEEFLDIFCLKLMFYLTDACFPEVLVCHQRKLVEFEEKEESER